MMERRPYVPDVRVVADQIIEDLRSDPRILQETYVEGIWNVGAAEYLDAVGTVTAHDVSEDDLIDLTIELARRVIEYERIGGT